MKRIGLLMLGLCLGFAPLAVADEDPVAENNSVIIDNAMPDENSNASDPVGNGAQAEQNEGASESGEVMVQ